MAAAVVIVALLLLLAGLGLALAGQEPARDRPDGWQPGELDRDPEPDPGLRARVVGLSMRWALPSRTIAEVLGVPEDRLPPVARPGPLLLPGDPPGTARPELLRSRLARS